MARSFNGSTDKIVIANVRDFSTTAFTVCFWFWRNTGSGGSEYLWSNYNITDTSATAFLFWLDASEQFSVILFLSSSQISLADVGAVSKSVWHHAALSYDNGGNSSGVNFYLNGVKVSHGTSDALSLKNGVGSHSIGARIFDDTRTFDGYISHFSTYERVLADEEIAQLAKGLPTFSLPNGLISYMPLWGVGDEVDYASRNVATLDGTSLAPIGPPVARLRPMVFPEIGIAATGSPWYYYANQAILAGA